MILFSCIPNNCSIKTGCVWCSRTQWLSWNHYGWKRPLRSSPAVNTLLPILPSVPQSTQFLNATRDGDSTTSLGSPFQHLNTLSEKKFFLLSNLNLPLSNLRPFPLVLLLLGLQQAPPPRCNLFSGSDQTQNLMKHIQGVMVHPWKGTGSCCCIHCAREHSRQSGSSKISCSFKVY